MNRKSTYNHSVKPGRWINRFFDVSTSHYISLKSLWTCHCLWMNNESCIRHDAIIRWNVIRRIATFRRNVIWRIGMRLNVIRCFDETSFDELTRLNCILPIRNFWRDNNKMEMEGHKHIFFSLSSFWRIKQNFNRYEYPQRDGQNDKDFDQSGREFYYLWGLFHTPLKPP